MRRDWGMASRTGLILRRNWGMASRTYLIPRRDWWMASRIDLILRSPRSGRLEGRTMNIQRRAH
jgi:hypothetical protein